MEHRNDLIQFMKLEIRRKCKTCLS